jgi:hypothetical protein
MLDVPDVGNAVNETLHGESGDVFYELALDEGTCDAVLL